MGMQPHEAKLRKIPRAGAMRALLFGEEGKPLPGGLKSLGKKQKAPKKKLEPLSLKNY